MYEYIKGLYKGMNKNYIVIENNGIGYKIFTSGSTIADMPKIDEEVILYTQMIVREDFIGIYGFLTQEELSLFNLLLTINGVGAKASLSLLSISSALNLKYAILTEDEKTLLKAPGIGKKTAQRIILELKDKIKTDKDIINEAALDKNELSLQSAVNEATCALISLGYSEKEANEAIKKVDKSEPVENMIKKCLKYLMN